MSAPGTEDASRPKADLSAEQLDDVGNRVVDRHFEQRHRETHSLQANTRVEKTGAKNEETAHVSGPVEIPPVAADLQVGEAPGVDELRVRRHEVGPMAILRD